MGSGSTTRLVMGALAAAMGAVVLYPRTVTGTIEEQRARLPPPAECSDPVEGVWMALKWTERYGEWYEYTLNIRRAAPGSDDLVGEIASHYWYGGKIDDTPPECKPGGFETLVRMPEAKGKTETGGKIAFGASRYENRKQICGAPHGYNPDNFSGTIDPALQEFQSVNNDGGKAVNEPAVFRRIKCFDPPRKPPEKNVSPPAFAPAKRGVSCGR